MMRVQELLRLPRGKPRRQVIDDVTVGVLTFGDQSVSGVTDVSARVSGEKTKDVGVAQAVPNGRTGEFVDEDNSVVCDLIDRTKIHPESRFFF